MTLHFDAGVARDATALIGPTIPPSEGSQITTLTGSSEELLAHLLIRLQRLPPDIAAAIRAATTTAGGAPSRRPLRPHVLRLRETHDVLAAAMEALMQAEPAARVAADAVTASLGVHAAERPGTGGAKPVG